MVAGPEIEPGAALPKYPAAGAANAAVLNHSFTVSGPAIGAEVRSGRVARPLVEVARPGSSENPLWTIVISEYCQPPSSIRFQALPVRNQGTLQMALKVN